MVERHSVTRLPSRIFLADPADVAIGVYWACGLTDRESQLSFARPST